MCDDWVGRDGGKACERERTKERIRKTNVLPPHRPVLLLIHPSRSSSSSILPSLLLLLLPSTRVHQPQPDVRAKGRAGRR